MKCTFCNNDAKYLFMGSKEPVCLNHALDALYDYKRDNNNTLLPTDTWETYYIKFEEINE